MSASVVSRGGAGDAMSELGDAGRMLDLAERAATAGDLAAADELLRSAARIQEDELGPLHPDLANTLNNLAIVAEKIGQLADAETSYRRAAAIASASLPADHPMVADSRQNLEDFCRARGLPIDATAVMTPSAADTEPEPDAFAVGDAAGPAETIANVRPPDAGFSTQARLPSGTPRPTPRPPALTAFPALPPAPRRAWRPLAWLAIVMVVLATGALLVLGWPSSSRQTSTPGPIAAPTAPQIAKPALPPPTLPAPIDQAQPSKVVPRGDDRDVITNKPRVSAPSSEAINLITAQLCETFSASGGSWRCDPAGDSVAPGPIVLYTRARSLRDAAVVHRWYRGDTLRQSVKLTIRANPTAGYRTYSRQTVNGGDWRVEVRSEGGDLLHERRFAVR
jgi:Tfp pilus assembly protein PilF